ncbi:MAG: sugar-binding transcriptional regulator [Pantoea sp.]|uniref:sugar-binding transcriptional regulator n=1 Tax=Pantoea sp. TaxID=69393 RepID=UPI00238783DA|nr:sugar-binding transcriptional regulator [Pantoea sp.]MDE1187148.1 sugar-binding transcriptional regulator [Pantoea sp.]
MLKQNDLRLVVKIATLYYGEGMKQTDIARALNLSQSFVSRALNRSIKDGIVKISVMQPPNIFSELERGIERRYGLQQAIVVDATEDDEDAFIRQAIGTAAAHYLETRLRPGEWVGISSWSSTIKAMVSELHTLTTEAAGVIQLLGGVGVNGNVQATILTQSLADMLGCKAWLLPAQSIEGSVNSRIALAANKDVREVLEKFDEVTLALVGIGDMEPSQLLRYSGNYYDKNMLTRLAGQGAVGDICLHYYNAQGQAVLEESEDPAIGMRLEQLKRCPQVVGLAGGRKKLAAIQGALKGGYLNVLITDFQTARLLVSD